MIKQRVSTLKYVLAMNNNQKYLTEVFKFDNATLVYAPEKVFQKDTFKYILLQGGNPINEILFDLIKYFVASFDDNFFYLTENTIINDLTSFTFSNNITWQEFDKISETTNNGLTYLTLGDYYIYGQSGKWGIYRSEYWCIDIIGCENQYFSELNSTINLLWGLDNTQNIDYIISLIEEEYNQFPNLRQEASKFIENYFPYI